MLRRLIVLGLTLVAFAGCESPPVEWRDPVAIARPSPTARLVVDTTGSVRYVADSVHLAGLPPEAMQCTPSVTAAVGTVHTFAVWWAVRRDSSANLLLASSPDSGKTWAQPQSVDTTDVSSSGCRRPPPSLTTVGDDVYVAYSMFAPEGKGVFFAHTMGSMLHSPVPVIYGERLVATAIAAQGDRVAVAYEEPNGAREQVDVATSTTQGHLFEMHTVASRDVDAAALPSVAFAGRMLAVGWAEKRASGVTAGNVVRVGRLK
ncbi:MAG TPA: hypothetical protein VN706_06675 [Gemmatimonadaceae bacterium]|nr:hypothetical protein [Gemmatimonadaceae bacterium]